MSLPPVSETKSPSWKQAYRMRWRRRGLLWRSWRSRHQLFALVDRTAHISQGDILLVVVLRNENIRLPHFLSHYRELGVDHFLVVDNGSEDGGAEYLSQQQDTSVWQTKSSYHVSRFGLDWLTWLQMRYAHNHWCLTVDADELLVYSGDAQHDLRDLTNWLDTRGQSGFGALMLDLYPKGPLDQQEYSAGQDPREVLGWFDDGPYRVTRQQPLGNLWVQGGVRERAFFTKHPRRSPTLNKMPLVRWNRRWAYVNSTHSLLPAGMNHLYDGPGGSEPSGVLLHTKFLPGIVSRSEIEKQRRQHFHKPQDFDHYYDCLSQAPDLWHAGSQKLMGSDQLAELGLMRTPDW